MAVKNRKTLVLAVISIFSGLIGTIIGRVFASALQTSPAWIGPAILVGSIALVMVGVLLIPAAIRIIPRDKHGPAA